MNLANTNLFGILKKLKLIRKSISISFETAVRVFLDENSIDNFDEFHSDFEDRIQIIGRVGKILTVIYTERGDVNRIISARHATKDEEDEYYGQFY